jgi:hypothetical protein
MGDSMSTIINATTTNGVVIQPDNSGSLALQTNNGTTALTIDTSQNVGIGTTSPAYKLDVNGSINISADSFYRIGASTDRYIQYRTANSDILYSFDSGDFYRQDIGNSNHSWFTGNAERMRIDSSGGVYIGKTTAAETTAGWWFNAGAGNVGLSTGNYFVINYVPGGASTMIDFRTGGASKGSISQNGTNTAYNTSSDYRLKENIVPLSNALDVINQLKPSQFDWKENGKTTTGFIAHELQEIVPDCVTGEKDAVDADGNPKYQGIDTSFLVATLTAAIQEQQTIINDLKARVEILEAK